MDKMSNIDDILTQSANSSEPVKQIETPSQEQAEPQVPDAESKPTSEEAPTQESENKESQDEKEDSATDEYGNETKKTEERSYTQEEVNRMIRERLARGKNSQEEQANQAHQHQPEHQQQDEGDWKAELEAMIDNTITKRTQQQQQQQWQAEQQQIQQDFEDKFTRGMGKYKDFQEAVSKQPITDSMMLAVRGMKDPAAFIYAASKTQADALKQIASLRDPLQQAAEIGRLDAKMKRGKSSTSAPKPINVASGDAKGMPDFNIDAQIEAYGRNKRKR